MAPRPPAAGEPAAMREHWSVQNGVLVYDGKGQSLQEAKDYGNFELWVDWRIQPRGDGIYLRGNPGYRSGTLRGPRATDSEGKFIGSGGSTTARRTRRPAGVRRPLVGEWYLSSVVDDRVTST